MADQYNTNPQSGQKQASNANTGPDTSEPHAKTNTMAIISLIAGILSWLLAPGFGGIAGVITGFIARKQIRESNGQETGNGLALTGIILSILDLIAVGVIIMLLMLGPVIAKTLRSMTP